MAQPPYDRWPIQVEGVRKSNACCNQQRRAKVTYQSSMLDISLNALLRFMKNQVNKCSLANKTKMCKKGIIEPQQPQCKNLGVQDTADVCGDEIPCCEHTCFYDVISHHQRWGKVEEHSVTNDQAFAQKTHLLIVTESCLLLLVSYCYYVLIIIITQHCVSFNTMSCQSDLISMLN